LLFEFIFSIALFAKRKHGEFSLKKLVGDDLNKIKRKFTPHATFDIQSQWHNTLAAHSRG
jgi:hypothetical protein